MIYTLNGIEELISVRTKGRIVTQEELDFISKKLCNERMKYEYLVPSANRLKVSPYVVAYIRPKVETYGTKKSDYSYNERCEELSLRSRKIVISYTKRIKELKNKLFTSLFEKNSEYNKI